MSRRLDVSITRRRYQTNACYATPPVPGVSRPAPASALHALHDGAAVVADDVLDGRMSVVDRDGHEDGIGEWRVDVRQALHVDSGHAHLGEFLDGSPYIAD